MLLLHHALWKRCRRETWYDPWTVTIKTIMAWCLGFVPSFHRSMDHGGSRLSAEKGKDIMRQPRQQWQGQKERLMDTNHFVVETNPTFEDIRFKVPLSCVL